MIAALAGCTSGYIAPSSARGGDIFVDACARCHGPVKGTDNVYFDLDPENLNNQYVAAKVRNGSLRMPKFPGITDAQMESLADFVIGHSRRKDSG
jgi:mono/diheme cytochrome c family protein